MFFSGSLQDGITLAVSQSKAVICFVRDETPTSTTWEEDFFTGDEFPQLLESRSVLLRLTKDSPEAGFLTSFCPIAKFPVVVVIKNGSLREYIVPDVENEVFQGRLRAALEDAKPEGGSAPVESAQSVATSSTATAPVPVPASAPVAESRTESQPQSQAPRAAAPPVSTPVQSQPEPRQPPAQNRTETVRPEKKEAPKSARSTQSSQPKKPEPSAAPKAPQAKQEKKQTEIKISKKPTPAAAPSEPTPKPPPSPRSPPKQYRLQVRLFDGSSIRSSFSPSQTIRADVRPWVDSQFAEERRPYNLKHILTPLPNRTLTIADEEQSLAELGLGSTANLVMVPIASYTEAYSSSGASLPTRAASSAYGLVSSAVGTATGLVGSLFGYIQPAAAETPPANPAPSDNSARPRAAGRGPNIRTLRDQGERDDRQLYNGNQLNFEPRRDGDRQ